MINALYKYVKFEAAKAILQNCSLKFSAPGTFNDPFDCDINLLDFNYNDKIHPTFQHEIGLMKKKYAAYPGIQRIKWEDGYKHAQVQKINKSRICCFSLVNSSTLMWSHYADSHNGICFEFDNNAGNKFLKLNNENISYGLVHYGLKERINYLQHDRQLGIFKLFFTKSEEWVYEKEFRMISLSAKDFEKFYPEFAPPFSSP